ncbi:hypothetical protein [Peribacillus muralis]|uniref:hypothetical protein n=1 Tax=Peribacillus muralis TaxID=264697 RepID=UPI00366B1CC1
MIGLADKIILHFLVGDCRNRVYYQTDLFKAIKIKMKDNFGWGQAKINSITTERWNNEKNLLDVRQVFSIHD